MPTSFRCERRALTPTLSRKRERELPREVHRMKLKSRILGLVSRSDLPPRVPPSFEATQPAVAQRSPHPAEPALSNAEHLGMYGGLVAAVREALEHFIVSQLRLHLA